MSAVMKLSNENNFMRNVKSGHIVLHRSINNDEWSNDAVSFSLWAKLLCMASYKDRINNFDGKNWELKTGQLVTTYSILGRMVQVGGKPSDKELIRNIIRKFKASGKITTEKSGNSVIITVLNYAKYQSDFFTAPNTAVDTAPVTALDTVEECNNDNGLNGEESAPVTAPNTAVDTAPVTAQNNTLINNTLINNKNNMSSGDDEKRQSKINCQSIVDAYNEFLGERLPCVKKISKKRERAIKSFMTERLNKNSLDAAISYFKAFSERAKPFYFGDNKTGWIANFDFVIREDTVIAVREGTISKAEFVG